MIKIEHKSKQFGISLLELVLVLAVISVIITMATRYFVIAQQRQKANDSIAIINNIAAASERWLVGHDDYSINSAALTKTDLINRGYLPDAFANLKNPWGGDINIIGASASPYNYFKIQFTNISSNNCAFLTEKLKPQLCSDVITNDLCADGFTVKIVKATNCFDKP